MSWNILPRKHFLKPRNSQGMLENDSHLRHSHYAFIASDGKSMACAILQDWLIQPAESQFDPSGTISKPVLVFVVWCPKHCPGWSSSRKPFLQQTAWQGGFPLFAFHAAHKSIHSFKLIVGVLIESGLPASEMVWLHILRNSKSVEPNWAE
jgi:hypothetical protein